MVVGALGAALPAFLEENADGPEMPSVGLDEAGRDNEVKMSGTGDAPVSADENGILTQRPNLEPTSLLGNLPADVGGFPMAEALDRGDVEVVETTEETVETTAVDADMGHGTRNPDTVDAGGPYGEDIPFDPYYEGDPITFGAEIEPTDEHDNYKFRWDVDGDGKYDGPGDASTDYFGDDGEDEYTRTFLDDYQGVACVQAWDGSWIWVTDEGNIMKEQSSTVYWYWSGHSYVTWGWQFEVTKDCTVDELGIYENAYGDPGRCLNMRIWDDTGTYIAQVLNPSLPGSDSWGWHSLATPADLYAGTTYTVSAYTYYYYYAFMPGLHEDNVDDSDDGIVLVGDIKYADGNNYPTGTLSTYYPMVDFHYDCTYAYPNVLEDCADVLVWNRDPTVFSPSITPTTTLEGEETSLFSAWMMDLGIMDEWEFQWDWGDGEFSDWMPIPT
jgi:hypothetical protein